MKILYKCTVQDKTISVNKTVVFGKNIETVQFYTHINIKSRVTNLILMICTFHRYKKTYNSHLTFNMIYNPPNTKCKMDPKRNILSTLKLSNSLSE